VRPRSHGGLILGLIRLRSSKFISIRINSTAQVANVDVTRRTIIPSPEKWKVGGSAPCVAAICERIADIPLASWTVMVMHRLADGREPKPNADYYATRHSRPRRSQNPGHSRVRSRSRATADHRPNRPLT
jgi:hypothetical protein